MSATARPGGLDHPWVPPIMRGMSRAHVWLYRRTGGRLGARWRVGSAFPRGVPVLLLTTGGRRTKKARTTPLLYLEDGGRYAVVGSQGGLPKDPHIPWTVRLWKGPAKWIGNLAMFGGLLGVVIHYMRFGPKRVEEQEERKGGES